MKLLVNHVLRDHVLLGGIVALGFLPFWGVWRSFVFWVATVLIDLDHFLHFLYCTRFKVFGVGPLFRFHEKVFEQRNHSELLSLEIFHTAEFLFLTGFLAAMVTPYLWPVCWGFVLHIFVDFVHLKHFKILTKRSHSLVEYLLRRKRMLAMGKDPDHVFRIALKALKLPSIFHSEHVD